MVRDMCISNNYASFALLHQIDLTLGQDSATLLTPDFRRYDLVIYRRRPKLEFLQTISSEGTCASPTLTTELHANSRSSAFHRPSDLPGLRRQVYLRDNIDGHHHVQA